MISSNPSSIHSPLDLRANTSALHFVDVSTFSSTILEEEDVEEKPNEASPDSDLDTRTPVKKSRDAFISVDRHRDDEGNDHEREVRASFQGENEEKSIEMTTKQWKAIMDLEELKLAPTTVRRTTPLIGPCDFSPDANSFSFSFACVRSCWLQPHEVQNISFKQAVRVLNPDLDTEESLDLPTDKCCLCMCWQMVFNPPAFMKEHKENVTKLTKIDYCEGESFGSAARTRWSQNT